MSERIHVHWTCLCHFFIRWDLSSTIPCNVHEVKSMNAILNSKSPHDHHMITILNSWSPLGDNHLESCCSLRLGFPHCITLHLQYERGDESDEKVDCGEHIDTCDLELIELVMMLKVIKMVTNPKTYLACSLKGLYRKADSFRKGTIVCKTSVTPSSSPLHQNLLCRRSKRFH